MLIEIDHRGLTCKASVASVRTADEVAGVRDRITIDGSAFVEDSTGREVRLRGVNVSGACKLPSKPWPACIDPADPAFASADVSFVGRPFPLSEARKHWRCIRQTGHNLVRLVVTWEAVEHAGPGKYDDEYLQYLHDLIALAREEGLLVFIDMHQDCWSRHSGGSGAPAWTFDVAGLDCNHFADTGAALLQEVQLDAHAEPGTLWATNYTKFATNTMFTLFWAGEVYAPDARIHDPRPGRAGHETINVGTLLRQCYVLTIERIFAKIGGLSNVLGLDAMNEPHPGFIDLDSMHRYDEGLYLHLGDMPSAAQSILLASGLPQSVPVYEKSWPWPTRRVRERTITPAVRSGAWRLDRMDIWLHHGVYTIDGYSDQVRFNDNYFRRNRTSSVEFATDFYLPFLQQCVTAAREASNRSDLWLFVEAVPHSDISPLLAHLTVWDSARGVGAGERTVAAPHWYDLRALFEKRFSAATTTLDVGALAKGSRNFLAHTYFGRSGVINNYTKQIGRVADTGVHVPVIIGETGVPMDMNGGYRCVSLQEEEPSMDESHLHVNAGYADRITMLDATISAMENVRCGYTLWNYTPENRAAAGGGDLWNGEDFSLVSTYAPESAPGRSVEVERKDAGHVLRATHGWVRPAVIRCPGRLTRSRFHLESRRFVASWSWSASTAVRGDATCHTAEVFVPDWLMRDSLGQATATLRVTDAAGTTEHARTITPADIVGQSLYIRTNGRVRGELQVILDFANRPDSRSTGRLQLMLVAALFLAFAIVSHHRGTTTPV